MICVGIDIAKGKSTRCFLKPGGEVLKAPYDIDHTAENITKLLEKNIFVCIVNALRMKILVLY